MKKKTLLLLVSLLMLVNGFSLVPKARAVVSQDPYLQCLCEDACTRNGWNLSVVGAGYEPDPIDASPECMDPSKGECICMGYGCGRASISYTSTGANACLAKRSTVACKDFYDAYNVIREDYIKENYLYWFFSDYQSTLVKSYHYNVLKLTAAFVIQRFQIPANSVKNWLIGEVQSRITDAVFSELQSDATKAQIQAALQKMIVNIDTEMAKIQVEEDIRINKLKDLITKMKGYACSEAEVNGVLPPMAKRNTTKLSDVTFGTPRDVAIQYLQQNNIVKGYDDGTFKPVNPINRAEFTKILMESAYPDEQFTASGCFPDAPLGAWYAGYVCAAKEKGIIGGYPDGSFKPANTINAAEMLKILLTTLKPTSIVPLKAGDPWYQGFWTGASDLGILPSDIKTPGDNITRGQMAETTFSVIADEMDTKDIWNTDYSFPESEMVSLNSIVVDPSVQTDFTWDFLAGTTPTTPVIPVTPVTPVVPVTPVTPTGSANNTIATATQLNIAVTQQTVNGTLTTAGDLNYFNFLFGGPAVLSYGVDVTGVNQTANPSQTVNYKGTVVSSTGVEQPCTVNASSSTPNSVTNANVSNNCYFAAGSWNIKVWGNGSTDYSATPFKLTFSKIDGALDGFEPNNTLGTATSFVISTTPQTVVNPSIWGRGDVDYYAFTLGAQSQLYMKLDVTGVMNAVVPANVVYYDARLLDSSGNELNCNMSASSFRLVHEKNDCIFPAGVYYMKVMGDSENEFSTSVYGLTLSAVPVI